MTHWKIIGRFSLALSVVAAALLFSAVSIYHYNGIVAEVRADRTIQKQAVDSTAQLAPEQRVAALLELEAMERRYSQAQAAMLSKLWTRSMGFVTGMLIALIGAAFVLGELRIEPAQVSGGTESLKLAITSSSPGIVLAVLGVVLIAISLSIEYHIDAKDVPIYYREKDSAVSKPEPYPTSANTGEGSVEDAQNQIQKELGEGN